MNMDCRTDGHQSIGYHLHPAERNCRPLFTEAIENRIPSLISAVTFLEASMVIETRKGETGGQELDLFIYRAGIEIVPVDQEEAEVARIAWRQYDKGRHPAGLNYGACFSYALAKTRGASLLFKGNDFTQTDLQSVDS